VVTYSHSERGWVVVVVVVVVVVEKLLPLINCFLSKKDDYNLESGQGGIRVYLVIYTRLVWHVVYDLPCHLTSKLDKKN